MGRTCIILYTFYPHFEKHHQGNVLDVFHPDAGGSKTRQWAEMEKYPEMGEEGAWEDDGVAPPWFWNSMRATSSGHSGRRTSRFAQCISASNRSLVPSFSSRFYQNSHGSRAFFRASVSRLLADWGGRGMGKGDGATIRTIDLRHGQNMRKPSGDAMEFEGNRKLLSRSISHLALENSGDVIPTVLRF